jgi:hypothetical protein
MGSSAGTGRWRRLGVATLATMVSLTPLAGRGRAPRECDETFRAGGYLLCTQVLHAGTRSEGRVGRLFLDDHEVTGRTAGETIEVRMPQGTVRFKFLGDQRPHLWSNSGWTADRRT